MIESIEIKNFRCFKDTKIAKFGLVNLFGGLNNAGKTALLEAIFLIKNPYNETIVDLIEKVRGESSKFGKAKPINKWDNLFYEQNKSLLIEISIKDEISNNRKITLMCDEAVNLIKILKNHEDINKEDMSSYINAISDKKIIQSLLRLNIFENDDTSDSYMIANESGGITVRAPKDFKQGAHLHLAHGKDLGLAEEFEKARFDGKGDKLLQVFQIIDKNIENVEIFFIGEPVLYLKRKNEKRMPIGLFGDAINKIAGFVLNIINNPEHVILIDEIENGIHYTNQEKLWKMLFDLAIEFNVQIFATTHSYEMARAFVNVIKENQFNEKAGYFELARHAKTGNVIGTSIPIDILDYDVENNFPFRGE